MRFDLGNTNISFLGPSFPIKKRSFGTQNQVLFIMQSGSLFKHISM